MLRLIVVLAVSVLGAVPALGTPLRGTVTLPADVKPAVPRSTYWRIDNGLLPVQPPTPDPRSEVVIIVDGGPKASGDPAPGAMDLKDLRFDPPIIVGNVGMTVQFKNSDRFVHRLYIDTKAASALMPPEKTEPGQTRAQRFFAAGEYSIRDKDFPHILGYVVVVDSSISTRADDHGAFKLDLAEGHYTLRAFFRGAWIATREIDVGVQPVDVELKMASPSR